MKIARRVDGGQCKLRRELVLRAFKYTIYGQISWMPTGKRSRELTELQIDEIGKAGSPDEDR